MHLITRSFDNIPREHLGYTVYAISTSKPQKCRGIPVLWLFAPTFEVQIEYNKTKDIDRFRERMTSIMKQRSSAIEDWVKANSGAKICLASWGSVDTSHRRLVAEAIRQAADKLGIAVTIDIA